MFATLTVRRMKHTRSDNSQIIVKYKIITRWPARRNRIIGLWDIHIQPWINILSRKKHIFESIYSLTRVSSIFEVGFEEKSARRGCDLHEARNIIIETAVLSRVRKWLGGGFSHRRPPANSAASKLFSPQLRRTCLRKVLKGGHSSARANFRARIFEIR